MPTATASSACALSSGAGSFISRATQSRRTSTLRTGRRVKAPTTTSSSTTARPEFSWRLQPRGERKGRRRVGARRRDLDRDDLMALQRDAAGIAFVHLRALAVPEVDVCND